MLENSQQFKNTERMINRLDEVIPFPSEWAGIADDMSQAERLKIADNLSNLAVMVARYSAYMEKRATADHAAAVTSQNVIAQRTRKALGYTFTEEKRIF